MASEQFPAPQGTPWLKALALIAGFGLLALGGCGGTHWVPVSSGVAIWHQDTHPQCTEVTAETSRVSFDGYTSVHVVACGERISYVCSIDTVLKEDSSKYARARCAPSNSLRAMEIRSAARYGRNRNAARYERPMTQREMTLPPHIGGTPHPRPAPRSGR